MDRALIRARVVPFGHELSDDVSGSTTVAERLALVAELSCEMWALAGLTAPTYARSETPVVLITRKPAAV